jgi:hypothetical protein
MRVGTEREPWSLLLMSSLKRSWGKSKIPRGWGRSLDFGQNTLGRKIKVLSSTHRIA